MPEGDTLHRLAARLSPALLDRTVRRAFNRAQGDLEVIRGATVTQISALGKNLVIELSGGWSFRVHLGIGGKCDTYPRGHRWRRSRRTATLIILTEAHDVVFFEAPQTKLVRTAHLRATPGLVKLGPDLLAPSIDYAAILERSRQPGNAGRPLGEVLLDQRIAAGIGNVYKSEVLFLRRLHPWAPLRSVDDERLQGLFRLSRELMKKNMRTRWRTTRFLPGDRHWVYGRTGRACFRCRTAIESGRQGTQARNTYFCPRCQRQNAIATTDTRDANA
ncbi:MAG: DNA-formamidopyrimidine glycosylase family protein [Myxococcota bacterium]